MRFHSLPTFRSSGKGMLTAQATDGRLCLAWAGAEPEGGAATLLDRVANALGAIAGLASPDARPLYTPADFPLADLRSEEHTSELQSLMRISYAVFCLKKQKYSTYITTLNTNHILN